jgi:uncharacterized repeat protein (TIGR01451 family)
VVGSSLAETVTNRPVADACLFEPAPNNNLGGSDHVAAGTIRTGTGPRTRALYRFDLTNIPTNAVVTSARATFRVVRIPPNPVTSAFGLHRMLQSWSEGTRAGLQGAAARAGDVTWNRRAAPATTWAAPGGLAGQDYAAAASATTEVAGLGVYTFASGPELVADVQAWVQDPGNNFGWIMITQSEAVFLTARRFATREQRSAGNIPTLIVEYTIPPPLIPPSITAQPESRTVELGLGVAFRVTATGTEPILYQWQRNGNVILDATNAVFELAAVRLEDAGEYRAVVRNAAGAATSDAATLVVVPPQPTLADLALGLSGRPEPVEVEGELTHTIVVTNRGPARAPRVVVTDTFPASVRFVSAEASQGSVAPVGTGVSADLGALDSGRTASVVIVTRPTVQGLLTNRAEARIVTSLGGEGGADFSRTGARLATAPLGARAITDPDPANNAAELVTTVVPPPPEIEVLSGLSLNRQTGLFEQRIRFNNRRGVVLTALRVHVTSLPPDVVLFNGSGKDEQGPFVRYNRPVNSGAGLEFHIEFHRASRVEFATPAYQGSEMPVSPEPVPLGSEVPLIAGRDPTRITTDPNRGRFMLEFRAQPGRRYVVRYRDRVDGGDGGEWRTAVPPITAAGTTVQWFDDGPPKTVSAPTTESSRFYSVIESLP